MVGYNSDMQKNPTKRQKDLLQFIYAYIKSEGYPPTFKNMREALGVSSNQSIIDLLDKLKEKKIIKRDSLNARSLAILPLGYAVLGKPPLVAFLGATSAGAPLDVIEVTGEWSEISQEVAQLNEDVYILKISGDSMINAGINDGDMIIIQSSKEYYSGEIVLAQVGNETTVKRFISEDKPPYTYLKPENPKYQNILFKDDVELKGKVISVLKNGIWKGVK